MSEAQLQTKNGVVIPLLGVDAVGSMVGLFLRMTITQRYHNNTHDPLEVMYTFPLPAAAVLLQAEIHVRGVVYQSQVHAKPKASKKYTEAVAAGDREVARLFPERIALVSGAGSLDEVHTHVLAAVIGGL